MKGKNVKAKESKTCDRLFLSGERGAILAKRMVESKNPLCWNVGKHAVVLGLL